MGDLYGAIFISDSDVHHQLYFFLIPPNNKVSQFNTNSGYGIKINATVTRNKMKGTINVKSMKRQTIPE